MYNKNRRKFINEYNKLYKEYRKKSKDNKQINDKLYQEFVKQVNKTRNHIMDIK